MRPSLIYNAWDSYMLWTIYLSMKVILSFIGSKETCPQGYGTTEDSGAKGGENWGKNGLILSVKGP